MVVAHALGHSSTRMVERHYGHLSQNYIAEAIRKGAPRFGKVFECEGAVILRGPDDEMPFFRPDDFDLVLDQETYERLQNFHFAQTVKFQHTFVSYFPDLADLKLAAAEWDWLFHCAILNFAETLQRSKAKASIRKLANALRVLSTHDLRAPLILPDINWNDPDPVVQWENEIVRTISTLIEMERQGLTLKVIDRLVADSDALIEATPETANVNWAAVNAVGALRWLWQRNTGRPAPARALNPASKFCAFLRDGFEFLGIEADPVSAFKRWVKRDPKVV